VLVHDQHIKLPKHDTSSIPDLRPSLRVRSQSDFGTVFWRNTRS
jgi:hypothetical protein